MEDCERELIRPAKLYLQVIKMFQTCCNFNSRGEKLDTRWMGEFIIQPMKLFIPRPTTSLDRCRSSNFHLSQAISPPSITTSSPTTYRPPVSSSSFGEMVLNMVGPLVFKAAPIYSVMLLSKTLDMVGPTKMRLSTDRHIRSNRTTST